MAFTKPRADDILPQKGPPPPHAGVQGMGLGSPRFLHPGMHHPGPAGFGQGPWGGFHPHGPAAHGHEHLSPGPLRPPPPPPPPPGPGGYAWLPSPGPGPHMPGPHPHHPAWPGRGPNP